MSSMDKEISDTERLEWLIENCAYMRLRGNDKDGWILLDVSDGLSRAGTGKTAHECIDNAIRKQKLIAS